MTMDKPTLLSKKEWDAQRKNDLANAIFDRIDEGKRIPEEWTKEYNSLIGIDISITMMADNQYFQKAMQGIREEITKRVEKKYGPGFR